MEQTLANIVDKAHSLVDFEDDSIFGGYPYLRGRGVTDEQIREFKIGIGPARVRVKEESEDHKKFNRQFRGKMEGQLVFPIHNASGKLRGVETRMWEETDTRKYSQYWLSSWKEDAVFLGLPQALEAIWATRAVFLVEGVFDFFVVQRVFPNTLCPLAARIMWTQHRFLERWCRYVVFMFDTDEKGRNFTEGAIERYNVSTRDGFMVHRMAYPAKDPSALYDQWGYPRFERFLQDQASKLNLYL